MVWWSDRLSYLSQQQQQKKVQPILHHQRQRQASLVLGCTWVVLARTRELTPNTAESFSPVCGDGSALAADGSLTRDTGESGYWTPSMNVRVFESFFPRFFHSLFAVL